VSAIPPNWLSSIIQTGGAHDRATQAKAKEDAATSERASGNRFAENLQDIIESSDRDAQVYADAEGAGSQGRDSDDTPTDETDAREESEPDSTDAEDEHLDIQA